MFTLDKILQIFLSIEFGINARIYNPEFELPSGQVYGEGLGFFVHQLPINTEFETNVYKDRISAYGSIDYTLAYSQIVGHSSGSAHSPDGLSTEYSWDYIAPFRLNSLFSMGFGSRFRLVDQLQFDLELNYVFGFQDIRAYHFDYFDLEGNSHPLEIKVKDAYWQFKFGFSYPIQSIGALLRDAGEGIKECLNIEVYN
jgi:hypothetical protein